MPRRTKRGVAGRAAVNTITLPVWDTSPVIESFGLAASSAELRIAVVGLESGELRYVTGKGTLVDRENRPVPGMSPVSVVDAVRASGAIPAVFAPVEPAGEH